MIASQMVFLGIVFLGIVFLGIVFIASRLQRKSACKSN